MKELYYIGLDVHKKSISYTIKQADSGIVGQGQVEARRAALSAWAGTIAKPWVGALKATLFTGWIYDHPRPFADGRRQPERAWRNPTTLATTSPVVASP